VGGLLPTVAELVLLTGLGCCAALVLGSLVLHPAPLLLLLLLLLLIQQPSCSRAAQRP
jgi:hypothetical protein